MAAWSCSTPSSRLPCGTTSRNGSGGRSRPRRRSRSCATTPTSSPARGRHPAMFADHGVVHVRDVAIGLIRLLETIDGVLLPRRPGPRRRFVEAYGVAAAYLHDIGMVDLTPVGRRTHPHFAAHAAFGPDVTPLVDHLLGPGAVRDRLDEVTALAPFATSDRGRRPRDAEPVARPQQVGGARRRARRSRGVPSTHAAGRLHRPRRDPWRRPAPDRVGRRADPVRREHRLVRGPERGLRLAVRHGRSARRLRRRRGRRAAGVAGSGRAAAAGDGAPDVRRVRAVHRRRDRQRGVHAAARGRRGRLRHQLRRPPVCRRGQHQGRVRDAAGEPAHRRSTVAPSATTRPSAAPRSASPASSRTSRRT